MTLILTDEIADAIKPLAIQSVPSAMGLLSAIAKAGLVTETAPLATRTAGDGA